MSKTTHNMVKELTIGGNPPCYHRIHTPFEKINWTNWILKTKTKTNVDASVPDLFSFFLKSSPREHHAFSFLQSKSHLLIKDYITVVINVAILGAFRGLELQYIALYWTLSIIIFLLKYWITKIQRYEPERVNEETCRETIFENSFGKSPKSWTENCRSCQNENW